MHRRSNKRGPKSLPMASGSFQHTCITCRVAFQDSNLQRGHYKTDWHRYNLKRKVVELPPVTAEEFQKRVLAQREANAEQEKQPGTFNCDVCKKHFSSQNAYETHLQSRKHREAITKAEKAVKEDKDLVAANNEKNEQKKSNQDDAASDVDIDNDEEFVPEPLDITECLFCPHDSVDLESSLKHMGRSHGFMIPDLDYLINVKGLMSLLCEKVGVGNMCLYCNTKGKAFHSVEAVQNHMVDKGHCKLLFDGDAALEYSRFYDYRTSYPDRDEQSGSDDDTSDVISGVNNLTVNENLELVLPSGATVGHRSLKLYYQQHLPSEERTRTSKRPALVGKLMTEYRALGWKGKESKEVEVRKAKQGEASAYKDRKQQDLRMGVKGNKLQTHFRPQVIF